MVAVMNCHTLSGVKQQKCIASQFWRLELCNHSVGRAMLPLKPLGKKLVHTYLLVSAFLTCSFTCRCVTSILHFKCHLHCVSSHCFLLSVSKFSPFVRLLSSWVRIHLNDFILTWLCLCFWIRSHSEELQVRTSAYLSGVQGHNSTPNRQLNNTEWILIKNETLKQY